MFCSKDVSSFNLVGGLNNFLNASRCLGFAFFILIEMFRNSASFRHFDTAINSIETLKFSWQFGFQE